jgi:acyl carrier protein
MSQSNLSAPQIESWFIQQMAEQLDLDPAEVDPTATFDSYALDSAKAMLVASRAEKMLGFQLSPTLLFHYPTIQSLAQRLAEEATAMEADLFKTVDPKLLEQILSQVERLSRPS